MYMVDNLIFKITLVCFDALHPSQQFFSLYSLVEPALTRTQHSDSTGGESQTSNPLIHSQTLNQLSSKSNPLDSALINYGIQ